MKQMGITEFKNHALRVLADVAQSREAVRITKRGKPLAEVVPCRDDGAAPQLGTLAHTVVHEDDLITPLGPDDWEACK